MDGLHDLGENAENTSDSHSSTGADTSGMAPTVVEQPASNPSPTGSPALFSTPSPTVPVSTSRASPEFLTIIDFDNDGRFDTVEIRYSENLSGTASPEDFALYSASGGLYAEKVSTLSGYFSSVERSGKILRLSFSGTTLSKPFLKINASTASEFRIKSLAPSRLLTESSGLSAIPLALTTSFSGYANERVAFIPLPPRDDDAFAGRIDDGSASEVESEVS